MSCTSLENWHEMNFVRYLFCIWLHISKWSASLFRLCLISLLFIILFFLKEHNGLPNMFNFYEACVMKHLCICIFTYVCIYAHLHRYIHIQAMIVFFLYIYLKNFWNLSFCFVDSCISFPAYSHIWTMIRPTKSVSYGYVTRFFLIQLLSQNKKERKKVREVGILKKDPEAIREQIEKLEKMSKYSTRMLKF